MQWCKCLKNSIKSFMVNLCVVSDTLEMNWICDLSIGWSSDSVFTPFKLMLSSNGKFVQTTERYKSKPDCPGVDENAEKGVFVCVSVFSLLLFAPTPSTPFSYVFKTPPPLIAFRCNPTTFRFLLHLTPNRLHVRN